MYTATVAHHLVVRCGVDHLARKREPGHALQERRHWAGVSQSHNGARCRGRDWGRDRGCNTRRHTCNRACGKDRSNGSDRDSHRWCGARGDGARNCVHQGQRTGRWSGKRPRAAHKGRGRGRHSRRRRSPHTVHGPGVCGVGQREFLVRRRPWRVHGHHRTAVNSLPSIFQVSCHRVEPNPRTTQGHNADRYRCMAAWPDAAAMRHRPTHSSRVRTTPWAASMPGRSAMAPPCWTPPGLALVAVALMTDVVLMMAAARVVSTARRAASSMHGSRLGLIMHCILE